MDLTDDHLAHLRSSGLSDETLERARVHSLRKSVDVARALGYEKWRTGGGAIAFPVFLPDQDPATDEPVALRLRPDFPRLDKRGKPVKYDQRATTKGGPGVVVYFPPRSRESRLSEVTPPTTTGVVHWTDSTPSNYVVWTEGEKKSLLLDQLGYATIGLTGVECFHDIDAKQRGDGLRLHQWILAHVVLIGRTHLIAFDSDSRDKEGVLFAEQKLAGLLRSAGAIDVRHVDIPDQGQAKFGVDDFFVKFGEQALRALFVSTRPLDAVAPELPLRRVRDLAAFRDAPDAISRDLRVPEGYEIGRDGALWELPPADAGDGGKPKRITTSAPVVTCVLADLDQHTERIELVARSSSGAWRTVIVPRGTVIAGGIRAVELLGNLGLEVLPKADIGTYLAAFERENGARVERAATTARAGWHGDGDERVFLLGTVAYDHQGEPTSRLRFDEHGSAELARTFRPGGDADEHVGLLRDGIAASDVAAAIVFAAFATPLLKPLGVTPFGFHLVGKSSRGKTTALQLGAGVYGCPETHGEHSSMASWDGTVRGLELYAQTCSDLPLCIDESSVAKDREKREQAIYQIINGRGAIASKRDGTGLRSLRTWRTLLLSTGEQQLADERTHTGAQVRTIQAYVDGLGKLDAAAVDSIKARATRHFGHVGQRWIRELCKLGADAWASARGRYEEITRGVRAACAASSLAARQAAFFALLILAERMAARMLQIGDPEGATMRRFTADFERRLSVPTEEVRGAKVLLDWMDAEPGAFPDVRPNVSLENAHDLRDRDASGRGFAGFRGLYKGTGTVFLIDTIVAARFEEHGLDFKGVHREWARIDVAFTEPPHLKPKVRIGGEFKRRAAVNIAALVQLCDDSGGRSQTEGSQGSPSGGGSGDSGDKRVSPLSDGDRVAARNSTESQRQSTGPPLSPLFANIHPPLEHVPSLQDEGTASRARASMLMDGGDSGDTNKHTDTYLSDSEYVSQSVPVPTSVPTSVPSGDSAFVNTPGAVVAVENEFADRRGSDGRWL